MHSTSTFSGYSINSGTMRSTPVSNVLHSSVRLSSSTNTSGDNNVTMEEDVDSDEEQFPPPPDFVCVSREVPSTPAVAPIQPVSAILPQQINYRSPGLLPNIQVTPGRPGSSTSSSGSASGKVPPPPPKRADTTKIQSTNPQHQNQMNLFTELQQATARQKQRIEGS